MLHKQNGEMGWQDTKDSWEFDTEANKQVAEKIDSKENVGFRDSGVGLSFSSRSFLFLQLRSTMLCFWFYIPGRKN